MAEQRLTTEDFASPHKHDGTEHDAAKHGSGEYGTAEPGTAGYGTAGHGTAGHDADTSREWREQDATGAYDTGAGARDEQRYDGREPVEQTPADRDVAEPDLTDRERLDAEPVADDVFVDETAAGAVGAPVEHSADSTDSPLFTTDDATSYRDEWRTLQADFVDDPREAVQRADELVAQVIQSLATTFAEHKRSLEGQWQEGEQVETEELRQALKRYRSFFDRLLSV